MLIRTPENEGYRENSEGKSVVYAEFVGRGLIFGEKKVALGFLAGFEENEGGIVVGGEHADLIQGRQKTN